MAASLSEGTQLTHRLEVVRDYERQFPDPIVVAKGDRVIPGDREPWEGEGAWVWCVDVRGKAGWVPEAYLRIDDEFATLLNDYSAMELTVVSGEVVMCYEEVAGGIWCENNSGEAGWVPTSFLRPLDQR